MAVRDGRGDVKQTTTGFRDPRHHICQKQIPIPNFSLIFVSSYKLSKTSALEAQNVRCIKKDCLAWAFQVRSAWTSCDQLFQKKVA